MPFFAAPSCHVPFPKPSKFLDIQAGVLHGVRQRPRPFLLSWNQGMQAQRILYHQIPIGSAVEDQWADLKLKWLERKPSISLYSLVSQHSNGLKESPPGPSELLWLQATVSIYIYICFSVQLSFTARPQGKTGPISRTNLDQYQKSIWTYIKDQSGPIFQNQPGPIWTNTRIGPLMADKLVSETS